MKNLNDLREAVKPEDQGEYDNEGGMAKTQLRGILRDAGHMVEMFSDEQNLPEWVQNKITKSADYLQSAHAYMMNKDEVQEAAPKVKARSSSVNMYKVKFGGDVTTVKAKDPDDALKKAMKDLGISSFNKSKYMKTASAIEESLDEASLRTKIAKSGGVADKIRGYGRKSGGIDKASFLKIAAMIDGSESNEKIQLAIQKMDTDPRDWILKTLDDSGFIKGGKVRVTESVELDEDVDFHVRMDYLKDADAKKVAAVLQKAVKGKTIQFKNETDKGATFSAKSSSDVTRITKDIAKISRAANIEIMEKLEVSETIDMSKAGKYARVMNPKTREIKKVLKTDLKKYVDKGWTHMTQLKNRLTKEVAEKKYTKPTQAEIDADKKKDRAGKAKPGISDKSLKKSIYKEEALEEKLEVSDGLDQWIKDFQASDAPQFQDQDKEEIRNMAIAAYLAAKRRAKGSTDTEESTKAYGKSMDDIKKKNISKSDKDKLKKLADLMKK